MRQRLERAGQRCISALVDVTNYVMLELGRPLHVYDLDKLRGGIDVRWGRKGEKRQAAQRADGRGRARRAGHHRRLGRRSASPASWAATAPRPSATRAMCSSKPRSSFPTRSPGARAATTSRATPRTASSAASTSTTTSPGIERATQLILEICGGEPGPVVDHDRAAAGAQAGAHARRAGAARSSACRSRRTRWPDIFTRLGLAASSESSGTTKPSWSRRRPTASTSRSRKT